MVEVLSVFWSILFDVFCCSSFSVTCYCTRVRKTSPGFAFQEGFIYTFSINCLFGPPFLIFFGG